MGAGTSQQVVSALGRISLTAYLEDLEDSYFCQPGGVGFYVLGDLGEDLSLGDLGLPV